MIFLTSQPLWLSAIILVALPVLIAMSGPVIVRRCVALEKLSTNNEVAGFKFATVGVLYAVLLAFAVVVVWEKFNDATKTSRRRRAQRRRSIGSPTGWAGSRAPRSTRR